MASTLKDITIDDVKDILGRALIDSDFRENLLSDTEDTLAILGFSMSDDSKRFFEALGTGVFPDAAEEVENRLGGRPVIAVWL